MLAGKVCAWCKRPMMRYGRKDRETCGDKCRQAWNRHKRKAKAVTERLSAGRKKVTPKKPIAMASAHKKKGGKKR